MKLFYRVRVVPGANGGALPVVTLRADVDLVLTQEMIEKLFSQLELQGHLKSDELFRLINSVAEIRAPIELYEAFDTGFAQVVGHSVDFNLLQAIQEKITTVHVGSRVDGDDMILIVTASALNIEFRYSSEEEVKRSKDDYEKKKKEIVLNVDLTEAVRKAAVDLVDTILEKLGQFGKQMELRNKEKEERARGDADRARRTKSEKEQIEREAQSSSREFTWTENDYSPTKDLFTPV